MLWIALKPSADEDLLAWSWRALQITPRVARVEEALLLEVGASVRLFGGERKLLRRLLRSDVEAGRVRWRSAATSLCALALLRLTLQGEEDPAQVPDDLPLTTLSAAREHAGMLERAGCRTWGQLRGLPRAGVGRRFGADLLQSLDAAFGLRAERYPWLTLPSLFDQKLELVEQATTAPELMWTAQRLLTLLQLWLQSRNQGVLALELEWTLGLRRLDGVILPPTERLEIRTGQPSQDMKHLRRLASEQLARTRLSAPATELRLRTLETVPWGGATVSLLPEDNRPGEKLHQLVERLSVRLGPDNVTCPVAQQDHRPERMQRWVPAREGQAVIPAKAGIQGSPKNCREALDPHVRASRSSRGDDGQCTDAPDLLPAWLLREPVKLQVKSEKPCYHGPLQLVSRARRLEAGWWDTTPGETALRDYFIARSEEVGLLWIYRERLSAEQEQSRWFLHGIYA